MTSDSHSSPIKTPKQLIVVVVLAFLVPVLLITFITQLVMSGHKGTNDAGPDESRVLDRIRPVGQVVLAEGGGSTAATQSSPGGVPTGASGVAKAAGDVAPATASNASSAAPGAPVPPAPASAPAGAQPTTVAAAAGGAGAAAGGAGAAGGAKADGKKVFETTCAVCHGAGIAGAPKFGDKAAWAPRIAQGINVLHQHALQGFQGKSGMMPPKGGNTALSDAEVQAAVDYMAAAAK